jgi:hypothetical protein
MEVQAKAEPDKKKVEPKSKEKVASDKEKGQLASKGKEAVLPSRK